MSIYLVEIDGFNPATEAVDTLFFGTHAYTSRPTDTPANTRFLPRVATALNLEQSMYGQGTTGGASEVGVGAVELTNVDGVLDYLLDWGFAGRAVRIYVLASASAALSSRTLVFRGTVEQPEFSLERVTFRVRDRLADLDKPLQSARFRGDNDAANVPVGIEGSADIAGQLKPVTIGRCRNVAMPCVCPQKLIYQAHDGPVRSIDQVYDSGAALLGANLVAAALWERLSGVWSVTPQPEGPSAVTYALPADTGELSQNIQGYAPGRAYAWTITLSLGASGSFVQLKNGATVVAEIAAAGTHTVTFTATSEAVSVFAAGTISIGDGGAIVFVPMNHANFGALEAADIPAGCYDTCLTEGLVRLGASPAGEVTADLIGANSGPNLAQNGHFDDTSVWTTAGAWTLDTDNHAAVKTAGATTDTLTHAMAVIAEATYRVRFIVRDYFGGTVQASIGATYGPAMSAAGVYTAEITAASTGPFRIWGQPAFAGTITAVDVRLLHLAIDDPGGRTVGRLLKFLAWQWGGVAYADLSLMSFTLLHDACATQVVGLTLAEETTVIAVLDAIAASVGAWWTFDPAGLMRVGRLDAPSGTPDVEFGLSAVSLESGGIERLATGDDGRGVPVYRVNVDYQRNNTVQTSSLSTDAVFAQSSVAGVVSDERRAWLNAEYRTASAVDQAVQVKYPAAPEMTRTTCLDTAADAAAEAARLLALHGTRRDRLRIRVPAAKARGLVLGDTVRVTFSRFGLAGGKDFVVIGRTDVLSGDQDTTDLDIWG